MNCRSDPYKVPDRYPMRNKSPTISLSSDIPSFNAANDDKMFTAKKPFNAIIHGSDKETGTRNPKITALLDEIMNDNSRGRDMDVASQKPLPPIAVKQTSSLSTITRTNSQKIVPPQPLSEVIAKAFPYKNERRYHWWISGDERDEDEEEHEHSDIKSAESINIADINPKMKFLPATVDGLVERFRELFREFKKGKHKHRNELVFLLDELLRQEGIDRDQYKQLNTVLVESLDEEDSDVKEEEEMAVDAEDEDDEVKKVIQTTFPGIIQHDEELLAELKDETDDEYIGGTYRCISY